MVQLRQSLWTEMKSFRRLVGVKYNVFETITMSQKFIKFFGYMCFSYGGDWPKMHVKLTFLDVLLCVVNLAIHTALLYESVMFSDTETISVVFNVGIKFVLTSLIAIGMISCLLNVILRQRIFQLLKCFSEFDSQVMTVGGRINHQKHFVLLSLMTIGVPSIFFAFLFSDVITGDMSVYRFLGLVSPVMSFVVTKGTFVYFLMSLKLRFQVLNQCFRENFCSAKNSVKLVKSIDAKESADPSLLVTKFATLHDNVSDATELTSLCFSFQAMIFTALCFVYNVFIIFSAFRVWMHFNEDFFGLVISNIHWSFLTYGFVVGEIYVAHNVTKLGKYTANLTHKAINLTTDAASIEKLKQMANQINHRPPVISCGLFLFDWTLFYSLCGASTTYLVILIQFDASMIPEGDFRNSTLANLTS